MWAINRQPESKVVARIPTKLGATFPSGASLYYSTGTPLTDAISYYPGKSDFAGFGNIVSLYSPAVSAGGNAATQGAGVGCNSAEANTNGTNTTTLEAMIGAAPGMPCVFGQASFVYGGATFFSDVPNEWWGNSTLGIGTVGTVPLNTGATAPGFYSGNAKLRVAFKGTGTNPFTYYSCKERFTNGSTRSCSVIGTGSYAITTLGDARVMTFNNLPAQTAPLTFTWVFVERGGLIYYGYQSKQNVFSNARLNTNGGTALLNQLGLTPEDPSAPLALTAGSYQGTWDFLAGTGSGTYHAPASLPVDGRLVIQRR